MECKEHNRDRYKTFRETYPEFIYENFQVQETGEELTVTYHFRIPGLSEFAPVWKFKKPGEGREQGKELTGSGLLEEMIFSLGMVELISYWKIACPPKVTVKAGTLTPEQIEWWKNLYVNGLGEFFYVNGIREVTPANFMEITVCAPASEGKEQRTNQEIEITRKENKSAQKEIESPQKVLSKPYISTDKNGEPTKVLVPIGGGKDSAVTLELLKEAGAKRFGYVINPRGATVSTAEAAGLPPEQVISVKRTLDKRMLELNRQGFLNGHTPFSAIVAFSSLIAAYLYRLPYIALSNESSANESTVLGSTVNHQYSKSFQFERDFHEYTERYLPGSGYYFSMLRPLSEFQIAKYFAGCKPYHKIFKSCNVGSKEDIWCGHCPKCLFVYLILSPFLNSRETESIFGRNLLEDESLFETLKQLTGLLEEKPFECVGSRSEVNTAIILTIERMEREGEELPKLFKLYRESELYPRYLKEGDQYSGYFDEENLVPRPWEELVRVKCCDRKV